MQHCFLTFPRGGINWLIPFLKSTVYSRIYWYIPVYVFLHICWYMSVQSAISCMSVGVYKIIGTGSYWYILPVILVHTGTTDLLSWLRGYILVYTGTYWYILVHTMWHVHRFCSPLQPVPEPWWKWCVKCKMKCSRNYDIAYDIICLELSMIS